MKKLISILIIFLSSCSTNTDDCIISVREKYPKSRIYRDPNATYRFFVIDSLNNLHCVSTVEFGSDISKDELFIEAK